MWGGTGQKARLQAAQKSKSSGKQAAKSKPTSSSASGARSGDKRKRVAEGAVNPKQASSSMAKKKHKTPGKSRTETDSEVTMGESAAKASEATTDPVVQGRTTITGQGNGAACEASTAVPLMRDLKKSSADQHQANTMDGIWREEKPESERSDEELPVECVPAACIALQHKYVDEKVGKRQLKRCTLALPYTMANYQIRLWADRYRAARNRKKPIDYEALSQTSQFKVFAKNPQKLKDHEPWLFNQLKAAYNEDCTRKAAAQQIIDTNRQGIFDSLKSSLLVEMKQLLREEGEIKKDELKKALQEERGLNKDELIKALRDERELNQAAQQLTAMKHHGVSRADHARSQVETSTQTSGVDHETDKAELLLKNKKLEKGLTELQSQLSTTLAQYHLCQKQLKQDELRVKTLKREAEKLKADLAGEKAISSGCKHKVSGLERELTKLKDLVANESKPKHDHDGQLEASAPRRLKVELDTQAECQAKREKELAMRELELLCQAKNIEKYIGLLKTQANELKRDTATLEAQKELPGRDVQRDQAAFESERKKTNSPQRKNDRGEEDFKGDNAPDPSPARADQVQWIRIGSKKTARAF